MKLNKITKRKEKQTYHHGNLAESLLNAVDSIATQFGLEAVTLRACARMIGVSPSSAFRHYPDKRALLTAFATRALDQLCASLERAKSEAHRNAEDAFMAVGLAYVNFALEKPAFFRAMWREETIYTNDVDYVAAACRLSQQLTGGFADTISDHDPGDLSAQELLAWSSVHGLANLLIDGPVEKGKTMEHKIAIAQQMIQAMRPIFRPPDMPQ